MNDLMKPRFKVIADYPGTPFKIGDILPTALGNDWLYLDEGIQTQTLCECEKYPALFKRLEWWEDREESELPKYVKCINTPDQIHFPDNIYQLRVLNGLIYDTKGFHIILSTNCYLPSTAEEYLNQNK